MDGVLEDNYFLQEKSEYGNTNQTNAFFMGPVVPGKLGVSVGLTILTVAMMTARPRTFC